MGHARRNLPQSVLLVQQAARYVRNSQHCEQRLTKIKLAIVLVLLYQLLERSAPPCTLVVGTNYMELRRVTNILK